MSMQGCTSTQRRRWPSQLLVSALIGLAIGLYCLATIDRFEHLLHPTRGLAYTCILATLCSFALGIWIPNRYAKQFSKLTRRYRHHARSAWSQASDPNVLARDPISSMQLKVIGAACLVMGGLAMMIISPFTCRFGLICERFLREFHWTLATWHVLDLCLVLCYVVFPITLLGMAFNSVQRVSILLGGGSMSALCGLAAGASLGAELWIVFAKQSAVVTVLVSAMLLLLAGLALMQTAGTSTNHSPGRADLPKISDRWKFALMWMLVILSFLLTQYLCVWHEVLMKGHGAGISVLLLAISAGLAIAAVPKNARLASLHNLAMLCMFVATSVVLMVILAGRSAQDLLGATELPFGSIGAVVVLVISAVLMGLVIGSTALATVQRSASQASTILSALLAICLGAQLALVTALVGLPDTLSHFHMLVMVALLWFAVGGLMLIYDPRFDFRRRWLQTAFMISALFCVTAVLPGQGSRWSVMLENNKSMESGVLRIIKDPYEAQRWLQDDLSFHAGRIASARLGLAADRLAARSHVPPPAPLSFDAILGRLLISKTQYSAIILTLAEEPDLCVPEKMQTALIEVIASKLRPDGVFVTKCDSLSSKAPRFRNWRRLLMKSFGRAELITLTGSRRSPPTAPWALLAAKDPSLRLTSTSGTNRKAASVSPADAQQIPAGSSARAASTFHSLEATRPITKPNP